MLRRYISRPRYERMLDAHRGTNDIKVITGVRRCGKSSLMRNLVERMTRELGEGNVFYRRMDTFGVPLNPTAEWLQGKLLAALERADSARPVAVLLDEIQDIPDWEKVVRRLHALERVDVYLTGSNAHVLSSDLATLLGGRYVELHVMPLSFTEFEAFWNEAGMPETGVEDLFAEYVRYGGMPAQFDLPERDEERMGSLLDGIHDTIVLNDVAMHAGIGDMDLLAKLVRFVFSTSGSLFSIRSVVNALASAGRRTTADTVDNYLRALEASYVLSGCAQAGLAGKQVLRPLRKFYPVDTGLRNLMTRFSPENYGAQLECVAYNELVRRGYDVAVGALRAGEVDFVASCRVGKLYVQVSETIADEQTFERELRPLEALPDSFPKLVLTLDHYRTGTTETGVQVVNLIDWLREG